MQFFVDFFIGLINYWLSSPKQPDSLLTAVLCCAVLHCAALYSAANVLFCGFYDNSLNTLIKAVIL